MATVKTVFHGAGRLARTTGRLLRSPDRIDNVRGLTRWWAFQDESKVIPERLLGDLFPGIEDVRTPLSVSMKYNWELPFGEKAILDGIVRMRQPQLIFEFGTATGATTVLLANAAPAGAVVHTVDLPEDLDPEIGVDVVGEEFRGKQEYASAIVQHRVDLRTFDIEPYRGAADFIFIDAGHEFDDVTQDSATAFEMLRPGGCIVWDDYQSLHWGTVRALNELSANRRLARIAYSRFVVYMDSDS